MVWDRPYRLSHVWPNAVAMSLEGIVPHLDTCDIGELIARTTGSIFENYGDSFFLLVSTQDVLRLSFL